MRCVECSKTSELKLQSGFSMDSIIKSALSRPKQVDTDVIKQKPSSKTYDRQLGEVLRQQKAKIYVVGCGGGGNNTIARLMQVGIEGAATVAVNTDAQDLLYTDADQKVLIGKSITNGLGAGANPKIGEACAKADKDELKKSISDADMVFVTCGLGGGTGTGSAPVVAEIAKKIGALTVGIVTLPFTMEGYHRMTNARMGLEKLEQIVDTLIVIPNERLLDIVPDVSINTAFKVADEVLVNAVKGVTELVTLPGLINLDFADVRAVMDGGGLAMIGMGQSDTEQRANEAVYKALNNPLIDVDVEGATGALVNVTGGPGMSLKEAREVVNTITGRLSPEAKVIWGAIVKKGMGETLRALVIVTGVKSSQIFGPAHKFKNELKKDIEQKLGVQFL